MVVWVVIFVAAADQRDPFSRQYGDRKTRTRQITISGLITALILITLFIAGISPTAKIGLYSLSSLFISIIIFEYGIRQGFWLYLAASLLSLAWPGLSSGWPFIFFFGLFPVWRALSEKNFKAKTAWVMKLAGANVLIWPAALLTGQPSFEVFWERFGWIFAAGIVLFSQIVILLYHWGLTLLMRFYQLRLSRWIK